MYSKLSKGITLAGIYITTFVMIICVLGMRMLPDATSYYDSMEFRELFVKKAGYVRDWIVRYADDSIFSQVKEEEIERYIANYGGEITREKAIEGILADRNSYYTRIQNELVVTNKNLDYLAVNTVTGKVLTNMKGENIEEIIKELTNRSNYLIGNGYYLLNMKYGTGHRISYYSDQYTTDLNYYAGENFAGQEQYRIYVALKDELVAGDDFYTGYQYTKVYQRQREVFYNICLLAIVVDILLMIYWILIVGKVLNEREIKFDNFDKISLETQCMIGGMVYLLFIMLTVFLNDWMGIDLDSMMSLGIQGINFRPLGTMVLFIMGILPAFISMKILSSWIKHIKNRNMLEHLWCYKVPRHFYDTVDNKKKGWIVITAVVGINLLVDVLLYFIVEDYLYSLGIIVFLPMVVWNAFCGIVIMKLIVDYTKILQVARAITEGELDRKIELDRSLPMFHEMADTINSMGAGLEKAVGESLKSERLKTELITNVSHDLKTPLTSIISYIDLLKDEKIENETAREYIAVLDERSHRLKQLVEDLVEASKAVTGNVKAELQVIRLDELVGQAVGEYQDRIEANNLVVVNDKVEEVWALADGRHMWRIIENLLVNVCKYAMPYTRVYIETYSSEGYGYCVIKNISKEPLNMDPKELTERFVRGDVSRTTEGSGLGLAIAKSLILLQQGLLDIIIDGDLFKVTVQIPLAPKEPISLEKE